MAIRNQSLTVNLLVWDTQNNCGKTGDANNITLFVTKDGGGAARTSVDVAEVSSADMPGVYKVTLTASEMDADFVCVSGKSSTPDVVVHPAFVQTERGDLATIVGLLNDIIGALPSDLSSLATKTDVTQVKTDILTEVNKIVTRLPADNAVLATASGVQSVKDDTVAIRDSGVKLNVGGKDVVIDATKDALRAVEFDELYSLPGASPKMSEAIMLLYMALRNKTTNNATATTIYKHADNGNPEPLVSAVLHDDGTVFTKGQFGA